MMKSCKAGASILEFLVYCTVMTMVIMLAMQWIVSCQRGVSKLDSMSTQYSALTAAHDLIMRDLACAHHDEASWKSNHALCVIWSVGDHDIGWELRNNALFRYEGVYSLLQEAWVTERSYKVVDTINCMTIVHNVADCSATCCLEGKGGVGYNEQRCVALHNGVLV